MRRPQSDVSPIIDPYSAPITAVPHSAAATSATHSRSSKTYNPAPIASPSLSGSPSSGPSINDDDDSDFTVCFFDPPIGEMGGYVRL